MVFIDVANPANTVERLLVTNMAADGIDGIGRVDHYAAFANNLGDLRY